MKIAHLTDLHLRKALPGSAAVTQRLSRRTPEILQRAIQEIKNEAPDLLVFSGDLVDFPTYGHNDPDLLKRAEEDLRFIAQLFEEAGCPYCIVHGNHDPSGLVRKVFGHRPTDFVCKGYRILCFNDDEEIGNQAQRLGAEREKYLHAIDDSDSLPQIHIQHYLVWPERNRGYPHAYREARHMRDQIVECGRVRLVLSGHYHHGVSPIQEKDTWFATAPALCNPPHRYWMYELNDEGLAYQEKILADPNRRSQKVVFLDRDGTINPQPCYRTGPEPFELMPGVREALVRLKANGFALVIITNQSCVGLGYVTQETVASVNDKMARLLMGDDGNGVEFDGVYCSHHSPHAVLPNYRRENHPMVKPNPGLLLLAAEELELDLSHAYMIGDNLSDLETGHRAGAQSILVRTGAGERAVKKLKDGDAAAVVRDLSEAADWILSQ